MATVLEERLENTEQARNETRNNGVVAEQVKSVSQLAPGKIERSTEDYEVIFLLDGGNVNQKAFDFAIQSARNFSARLVLVYLTKRVDVPSHFAEFARMEGIRDCERAYQDFLAGVQLESLRRKALAASVDFTTRVQAGDMESAVSSLVGDKRAIVIRNRSTEKGRIKRALGRLWSRNATKQGVPVIVF